MCILNVEADDDIAQDESILIRLWLEGISASPCATVYTICPLPTVLSCTLATERHDNLRFFMKSLEYIASPWILLAFSKLSPARLWQVSRPDCNTSLRTSEDEIIGKWSLDKPGSDVGRSGTCVDLPSPQGFSTKRSVAVLIFSLLTTTATFDNRINHRPPTQWLVDPSPPV
jgi:hypothetical protein